MSTPMYRHDMRELRELKVKKDEENRLKAIKQAVTEIYRNAISHAQTKSEPSYTFYTNEFQSNNIQEILSGLIGLFPDCTVEYAKMCYGIDGKEYDILTIDEKTLPFMNMRSVSHRIVIGWS